MSCECCRGLGSADYNYYNCDVCYHVCPRIGWCQKDQWMIRPEWHQDKSRPKYIRK